MIDGMRLMISTGVGSRWPYILIKTLQILSNLFSSLVIAEDTLRPYLPPYLPPVSAVPRYILYSYWRVSKAVPLRARSVRRDDYPRAGVGPRLQRRGDNGPPLGRSARPGSRYGRRLRRTKQQLCVFLETLWTTLGMRSRLHGCGILSGYQRDPVFCFRGSPASTGIWAFQRPQ